MNTSPIGTPLPRVDGPAKVTGAARYAADFNQPRMAHAIVVNATVGRGRIVRIDDTAALRLPGVLTVLSHRNAPRLAYRAHKGSIDPAVGERLHVLQDDLVRFHGQPVALVVAETVDQAERAARALVVEYAAERPLVALRDPRAEAIVPEAATRPGSRVRADTTRGDADAALRRAPVRVEQHYETARENHHPMEPHATVASWSGDRLTLWSKSQFVMNEQAEIAAVFGLPPENVRVLCPFIGGAFGTSLRTWSHVTLAALAARQVGRPVKLVLDRRQMFHTTGHRPATVQRVALGASREGRLEAVVHEGTGETSRHEQFIEALTYPTSFMYACANVRTRYRLAPLDTGTPNHMRGPGEATGMFALESALDELAVELGMDPVALRRLNEPAIDESENRPFSSRSLLKCYELGSQRFGWQRRDPRPGSMRDGRWRIGYGMASAMYPCLFSPASARVRLLADGTAVVEAASSDMGPGTTTSMTQAAAEVLGMPVERIRFSLGSTDFPPTPSHGGSQTMASVGSAVRAACLAAREQLASQGGRLPVEARASAARDADAARRFTMHAYGAVFAEVGVDPELGVVRVRRMVGAYAAGRIVNPKLAASQCTGGMIGGIGMALMERSVLDRRDGRVVNAHMADYLVPVNLDTPQLEAHFVEEEDPWVNPLGVKGLGEVALIGVAPAIANAVFHATGRRVRELPIRIEHLLHP